MRSISRVCAALSQLRSIGTSLLILVPQTLTDVRYGTGRRFSLSFFENNENFHK